MSNLLDASYISKPNELWEISIEGKYVSALKEHMLFEGVPENGVESIVRNAVKVLKSCPNPNNEREYHKTGIVIGKVQSGKTSNFLTLTALAFDNNYKIVIIMGGTKKLLVKQNSDRVSEYFERVKNEVFVFDTERHQDLINENSITQFINSNKKIIIVTLKSTKQIKKIISALFSNSPLSNEPVIVIDDEGDEASLNTLVSKGKKSATYSAIEQLKGSLKRHAFLSITATPQANILIDAIDILAPDFGVLVDPGNGYCGIDVFHGEESKYVITIPDTESEIIKTQGVPKLLQEALLLFFVGCSIRKFRGMDIDEKFSMLIHPSHIKYDHTTIHAKLSVLLKRWKQQAQNKNDISYKDLKSKLFNAYLRYLKDGVLMPEFDVLEEGCLHSLQTFGMHIVNGDRVTADADNFYEFNIYIGGNMLGRGLTLKGLAITYMVRTSIGKSNVDTVEQRARWFGYKAKYLDLCRVFLVSKIVKEFVEIRYHEQDLWETIKNAGLSGSRFKDIPRIFILTDNMNMTRSGVAKTKNYAYPYWNFQRHYQEDSGYIQSNSNIIKQYREKNINDVKTMSFGQGLPHKVLFGKSFREVKENIIDKFIFPLGSQLNSNLVSKVYGLLLEKGLDPIIDVIWIRDGEPSVHPVNDGIVSEYMSGRRPVDKSIPATYLGDRYFLVKKDVMQLQIHFIKKENTDICSHTLALYIPEDYITKITNLVIRA